MEGNCPPTAGKEGVSEEVKFEETWNDVREKARKGYGGRTF